MTMKMGGLLLWVIVGTFTSAASAASKIHLDVFSLKDGQKTPFRADTVVKPNWKVKEGNVRVMSVLAMIKSPELTQYDQVKSARRMAEPFLKGDHVMLRITGLGDTLHLKGKDHDLDLQIAVVVDEEAPVIDENCQSVQVSLRPLQKKVPFYLGTSCQKANGGLTVALTFPREVQFTSSTIFETKGKGEPWRFYDLGTVQVAAASLGKFTLEYGGTPYEFSLESLIPTPAKAKEKPERPLTLAAGVGAAMLSISGSDISASDVKPYLTLKVPHYPVWNNFGLAANANLALPITSGNNAVSYSQFELYASYEIPVGVFKFRPQVGYVVFSEVNEGTGIGLSASQLGLGLVTDWAIGESFTLSLEFMTCGLGSTTIASHYSIGLVGIKKKMGVVGFGLGARLQSFSATGEIGISRQYNGMLGYALVAF